VWVTVGEREREREPELCAVRRLQQMQERLDPEAALVSPNALVPVIHGVTGVISEAAGNDIRPPGGHRAPLQPPQPCIRTVALQARIRKSPRPDTG
jgi:hypothetical protein